MKTHRKKPAPRLIYGSLALIGAAILVIALIVGRSAAADRAVLDSGAVSSATSAAEMRSTRIQTPKGSIYALIADTPAAEERGLGYRDSLPADQGMLFAFNHPGTYGFWMKGMRFALDMIWIDAGKKVIGVSSGISPDSYPGIFLPPGEVSYVLELNAGAAEDFAIATGTALEFR
jgi:uncharacterized membrane protein (UPF0127 family)